MSGPCPRLVLSVALAAAALIAPCPRAGQRRRACRLCSAAPSDPLNARPVAPLRLQVETRLDFDKVVFHGQGSALFALSPDGAARLSRRGQRGGRARHAGQRDH